MPESLLTLPPNAGRKIVQTGALLSCPLLGTEKFVDFCRKRGLGLDRERLIRLERLGVFAPVFRVSPRETPTQPFFIPPDDDNDWFEKGWAYDTTAVPASHQVPAPTDRNHEGHYSIFQIDYLSTVLAELTLHVSLDSYVERQTDEDLHREELASHRRWADLAKGNASRLRTHQHRRATAKPLFSS